MKTINTSFIVLEIYIIVHDYIIEELLNGWVITASTAVAAVAAD